MRACGLRTTLPLGYEAGTGAGVAERSVGAGTGAGEGRGSDCDSGSGSYSDSDSSSPRKAGCAYSEPYTLVWMETSFATRSARCLISGMSGSSPLDVLGASFSLGWSACDEA